VPDTGADIARNRALWTVVNAQFTDEDAYRAWASEEPTWGLFRVPERNLGVLGDVAGLDVLELGCGTAYLSGWLARQGARPVGVDLTPAQLATAARCQQRFGLVFPLVEADAENVPLVDKSFDLVVSEYGASVWCDPDRWVARRPGCCALVGGWSLSPTASWPPSACRQRRASRRNVSCGRNGACIGWNGQAAGSSSTPAMASGSAC
jgi:SAM-dependent methyltransferase